MKKITLVLSAGMIILAGAAIFNSKQKKPVSTIADSTAQNVTQSNEMALRTLVIKNHIFTPNQITVPAGEKFKLIVDNQDPTPEEFESDDFRREKIIPGNSKAIIFVGPLSAGTYEFFGEFNEDTAQGILIVE